MMPIQVVDRLLQVGSIIYLGHENNLGMNPDAAPNEFVQLSAEIVGLFSTQHPGPQFRVGRVNGHIERREAVLDDSVQVSVQQVC
jgi:hypothetical protein